ncbi:MAG: hypothetical protein OHK0017_10300 [Patescibacteria group bacterium]
MSGKKYLKWATVGVSALLILWLLGATTLYLVAPQLIFKIGQQPTAKPDLVGLEQFFLKGSNQNNIDTWFYDNPNSEEVVLYLHGNVGRLPEYVPKFAKNYDVMIPSYPGYSQSEGQPNSEAIYDTAEVSYQELLKRGYQPSQIIVWGHSLGGSTAINLASRHNNIKKVVLVNTFSSIQSMCQRQYTWFLCVFGGGFMNSENYSSEVKTKVRQFHDKGDTVVPFEEGEKLFKSIGSEDKKFTILEGDHSNFDIDTTLRD